jgi:hypothetical protein
MQKSQVGQFVLTAVVVFVALIVLALFLALTLRIGGSAFLEMALNWFLRLLGLAIVAFGLISLLMEGLVSLEPEKFSKWIALILLGLLIVHLKWFLALGLVGLLITIMIIAFLKNSGQVTENGR